MPASASAGRSLKKATRRADRVLSPADRSAGFVRAQGNDQHRGHLHIAQIMRRASADGGPGASRTLRINSSRYVDVATGSGPTAVADLQPQGASMIH